MTRPRFSQPSLGSGAGSAPKGNRLLIGLVVTGFVALIGAVVAYFLFTFERVETEVPGQTSGMARVNPYHAAELFLEEMGIPAESRFGIGELPPSDRVVVILTEDLDSRHALQARLYEWVAGGGHLVVAAIPPQPFGTGGDDEATSDADPLLSMAGLALRRSQGGSATLAGPPVPGTPDAGPSDRDRAEQAPDHFPFLSVVPNREVVSVSSPATTGPRLLSVELDRNWTLIRQADEEYTAPVDPYSADPFLPLAYAPVAQGRVTALVDPYFMTNERIGDHDHARLLYALIAPDQAPAGAVLVVRAEADSFLGLVWRHGWMVLASLFALVLAWVWSASRRFGPTLPDPAPTRRSLLEHVEAMGTFLWRHGYHAELLASARAAVRHRLAARLGGATELEGGDLERVVSDETGIRESRIHEAFYGGQPKDKRAFTHAMIELQRLWREHDDIRS
jgi:hypothetical protein